MGIKVYSSIVNAKIYLLEERIMLFTILDIETTGFNRQSDDILEVGYIKTNEKCDILGSGSLFFYKPEFKVETSAQSVHRLTRDFLEPYEKDFNVNMAALYTMMYNGLIIGKNNASFDMPFIQSFIRKHAGYLDPCEIMGYVDLQDYYTNQYRKYYYDRTGMTTRKKGSLEELVHMIGFTDEQIKCEFKEKFPDCPRVGTHSALYDVYMTYILLKEAVEHRGLRLNV